MIGRTLSHFKILAKIGEGGMGVVYRAEDEKLRRPVALKVLPPHLVANEERRLRFLREARTAAAINHTNIATIYEVDEANGVVFIAMELVEGKTLREVMGGKPMSIKDTLRIATEMSEGLAKAHQAHVIHRDLKPENVIVTPDGHVKILDFGLAKLLQEQSPENSPELSKLQTISREMTRDGKIFGTASYMSPEQARGEVVDARSDLFSFGTTLYEMVTGKLPFQGKSDIETLSSIIKDEAPVPSQSNDSVPQELDRIISECLEKDPQERYLHTDQLVADLKKLKRTTDSGVQTVRTPSGPLAAAPARRSGAVRWARMHPIVMAALGVALVVAAVGTWRATRTPSGFKSGDRIIVADFENETGRPEFDTAIRAAFEGMLWGSRHLNLIGGKPLEDHLTSQGEGASSRIDRDLADALCRSGKCEGYLLGGIGADGPTFRLEASLYLAGVDRPLVVHTAVAPTEDDLLLTIHDMVIELRRAIGETPQATTEARPPTTRSVLAYQTYLVATGLSDPNESISVLHEAVDIDPGFVDAINELATEYSNLGIWDKYRSLAEEAYRRSSDLDDHTRLLMEIDFLASNYDFETTIERLTRLRRRYPYSAMAGNYLGWTYLAIYEDPVMAEAPVREAYELSGGGERNFYMLSDSLQAQGKLQELEQLIADFKNRGGSPEVTAMANIYTFTARDDWSGAFEALNRLGFLEDGYLQADSAIMRLSASMRTGRLAEAHRILSPSWRDAERSHSTDSRQEIGLAQAWLDMRRSGRHRSLPRD